GRMLRGLATPPGGRLATAASRGKPPPQVEEHPAAPAAGRPNERPGDAERMGAPRRTRRCPTRGRAPVTTVPCYTGRPIMADLSRHDGGLRPAVGVHNFQVLRANRTHPEFAAGTSFTYNHAPMLCYWKGRFYLQYLSSPVGEHEIPCHTLVCHSEDGVHWSKPQVAFPAITTQEGDMTLAHQRMGFYVSKSGRLLTLSFY